MLQAANTDHINPLVPPKAHNSDFLMSRRHSVQIDSDSSRVSSFRMQCVVTSGK